MAKLMHVKCGGWLRCKKNEVRVLDDSGVWDADLWACEKCGEEVITGFGRIPLIETHAEGFAAEAEVADYRVSR
jgi:hypothetical protein